MSPDTQLEGGQAVRSGGADGGLVPGNPLDHRTGVVIRRARIVELVGHQVCRDPDVLKLCLSSFEAVWDRAIPHEDYRPHRAPNGIIWRGGLTGGNYNRLQRRVGSARTGLAEGRGRLDQLGWEHGSRALGIPDLTDPGYSETLLE